MTARERAVEAIEGMDIVGWMSTIEPLNNPEDVISRIESAGLVILDRELYKALVEAVRAKGRVELLLKAPPLSWLDPKVGYFKQHKAEITEWAAAQSALDHAMALLDGQTE